MSKAFYVYRAANYSSKSSRSASRKVRSLCMHSYLPSSTSFRSPTNERTRTRTGKVTDLSKCEIHTVAGLLKNYFRSAPQPLLTFERYEDFMAITRMCCLGSPADPSR